MLQEINTNRNENVTSSMQVRSQVTRAPSAARSGWSGDKQTSNNLRQRAKLRLTNYSTTMTSHTNSRIQKEALANAKKAKPPSPHHQK